MCLLCWGKHLQLLPNSWYSTVCPLSYPAFTPSLESTWVEMQHITSSELIICRFPLISHSMFAALFQESTPAVGDELRVVRGIQGLAQMGDSVLGAYLNATIWNASVALKALVCISNGHSLEMPKK